MTEGVTNMFEDPMMKMWVSFIAMGLMFLSVILTIFSKEKLRGLFRYFFLSVSFIMIMASGLIIFLVVFTGPVPE
ncbi:DUF2768 domain-containing protein [Salisediminibacterium halotolerans]|nr:DUF2768 domain-containing protein [Salisediminibacterium halotolerans]